MAIGYRVRAEIRNSYNFDAVEVFDRGQLLSLCYMKQPVQGHDANAVASVCLCRGKLEDDIFQPTNARVKLPYDMNDEHLSLTSTRSRPAIDSVA